MNDVRNEILKNLDDVVAIVDENSSYAGLTTFRQEESTQKDVPPSTSVGTKPNSNNGGITVKRDKSFVFVFPNQKTQRKDNSNKFSVLKNKDKEYQQLEEWRDKDIAMKVIQYIPFTDTSPSFIDSPAAINVSTDLYSSISAANNISPNSLHYFGIPAGHNRLEDSFDPLTEADYSNPGGAKMNITSLSVQDRKKIKYIRQEFDEIDINSSGVIDKLEFRRFLAELNVHLSRKKFNLLWRAIDETIDDSISEDQIILFLFYEVKAALKEELDVVSDIRTTISTYLKKEQPLVEQWAVVLRNIFRDFTAYEASKCLKFEGNKFNKAHIRQSGRTNPNLISTQTFRLILEHFGMEVDSSGFKILVAIIDLHEDGISFQDFCELVLSPDNFKLAFPVNNV